MAASDAQTSVEGALFAGLIDHAALFPPASMSMPEAVAEDRQGREDAHAWMLARFICPASRLEELRAELPWEDAPGLSVVLDATGQAAPEGWRDALYADAESVARAMAMGAPVEAVEVRLPSARPESVLLLAARSELEPLGVERYFELVPGARWRDAVPAAIRAVAALGGRIKLRCGGAGAEAFPPVELVALVIACCRQAGVPFKATAGLHHPVRHVDDATGFHMHGFLNLLGASVEAHARAASSRRLEGILGTEEPGAFAVAADRFAFAGFEAGAAEVASARAKLFTGYGSCSWREPVEDLRALGMLA